MVFGLFSLKNQRKTKEYHWIGLKPSTKKAKIFFWILLKIIGNPRKINGLGLALPLREKHGFSVIFYRKTIEKPKKSMVWA